MSEVLVPDDAWSQLDPRQARLGKRARRGVPGVAAVTAATAAAITVGLASGEIGGNLDVPTWSSTAVAHTRSFQLAVAVHNAGWFDETITGVEFSGTALRASEPRPARLTIPHGRTRTLQLTVTVADCASARSGGVRPVVRLERFWGTESVALSDFGSDLRLDGPVSSACGHGG